MTSKIQNISIDELLQDTGKCMAFLQQEDLNPNCNIKAITSIIRKVLDIEEYTSTAQTLLNIAFRTYYRFKEKHASTDAAFDEFLANERAKLVNGQERSFQILYATLLSSQQQEFNANELKEICHNAFIKAVQQNQSNLLIILKTLNLLVRKYPELDVVVELPQVYFCLLSHQSGMREEILTYFIHCCRSEARARQYFEFVVHFYPWTCRNKYLMLSCILNAHNVSDFIQQKPENVTQFFSGLRLSLSYKRLLPPSQYLVKTLSKQNSVDLLQLSAAILTSGTPKEIRNFYAQWFSRIIQKDKLFALLQQTPEINSALENFTKTATAEEAYRFILIFTMYSRHILDTSKLHFFAISTELITNCFQFESDAQFLIFKFVVDNMNCFALEDCLEFLASFMLHHKNVENAQLRNSILGKMPTIINYISKCFWKTQKSEDYIPSTLNTSVETFFNALHNEIVKNDINNDVYQPKIYALKLLNILVKSLYLPKLEKNAKNCSLDQNSFLGEFLVSRGIFNGTETTKQLIDALYDPMGYDDALDLIVELLQKIENTDTERLLKLCHECARSAVIEVCALSAKFAKCSLRLNVNNLNGANDLFCESFEILKLEAKTFKEDPLYNCKNRHHIFGFLDIVNVVLSLDPQAYPVEVNSESLLNVLEEIENMILQLLNLNCADGQFDGGAASFQDMDESLEELVVRSAHKSECHEVSRKFLLMSFWLTLKSCCDVATTLGCRLVDDANSNLKLLQRCLDINVIVLTRCRHKGAIEAAGLSIGKLTKHLTSGEHKKEITKMFCDCLSLLLDNGKRVSTTRRGAGFAIMLLHVVKNDSQPNHPLLRHVMKEIFALLHFEAQNLSPRARNCDRIEALTLHYLCVLVKDAELREELNEYLDEIMLAAIGKIENTEWTICNAALQLFGALVPKIVGQRQATEFEEQPEWEPIEVTYSKIERDLPKTFEYILNYCTNQATKNSSTRSIILFLGFLSKVEHLQEYELQTNETNLQRLRALMWSLLRHKSEKVRKLAARCYVRSTELHFELPQALLMTSDLLFEECDENLFEGLLFLINEGVLKLKNEAVYTVSTETLTEFHTAMQTNLTKNFSFKQTFKLYTATKLLEMLITVGFHKQSKIIKELVKSVEDRNIQLTNTIGYEEWNEQICKFTVEVTDE